MKAIVVREWGGPKVLNLEEVPDPGADCDYCKYRAASSVVENAQ